MQGIIMENRADLYKISPQFPKQPQNTTYYEATARGKLKKQEIEPVVGDFVEFEIIDKQNKKAVIQKIFDREVYIKRPKLANITQMLFIISSQEPKPDLLLLDKQLAFAEYLGIRSVIVLNKIDLDQTKALEEIQKIYEKIGYKVLKTEAKNKKGVHRIKRSNE